MATELIFLRYLQMGYVSCGIKLSVCDIFCLLHVDVVAFRYVFKFLKCVFGIQLFQIATQCLDLLYTSVSGSQ